MAVGDGLMLVAPTVFQKGDQALLQAANNSWRANASNLLGRIFARSRWVSAPFITEATDDLGDSSAQFILVGDTKKNARFVVIDRT